MKNTLNEGNATDEKPKKMDVDTDIGIKDNVGGIEDDEDMMDMLDLDLDLDIDDDDEAMFKLLEEAAQVEGDIIK